MVHKGSDEQIAFDWLIDTPLFVSTDRIDSLYNAVALPETEEKSRTVSSKAVSSSSAGASVGVEGSAETGPMVNILTKMGFKVSTGLTAGAQAGTEEGTSYSLTPVRSPERRLFNVCLMYAQSFPSRCLQLSDLITGEWTENAYIDERPRALVFLDIQPGTPIVPMAAELQNGEVRTFFNELNQEVVQWGQSAPPKWPDENDADKAQEYWAWFREHPDSSKGAMRLMERVVADRGRPAWVDYRVPIADDTLADDKRLDINSLHLDIRGGEAHATGDFAYRLVHRGRKHGLGVVGLLKRGPALNVLAVYER